MDKLKYIKIEDQDGTISDNIPIGADAENIDMANGNNLETELVNVNQNLNDKDINISNLQSKDNELDEKIDNNINNLQSQVNSLASGSPIAANSIDEMIDTTKIYVNVSDGHWYYYNESSWIDGGIYQATKIANNSIDLDMFTVNTNNIIGNKKRNIVLDFFIGRWLLNQKNIDSTLNQWLSCNPIELKTGDKILLPTGKYVAQIITFTSSQGYQVANISEDNKNNTILIENDGIYALSLYIISPTIAPEITNEDLEYAKENIKISSFYNNTNILETDINILKNKLDYTSYYNNISISKGRWTNNSLPDEATIWCASEKMYLKKGDIIKYNGYLYQTQLIKFSNIISAPSEIKDSSYSGIWNIELDGYYALNIFKNNTLGHQTDIEWTDDEITELIQNISVSSIAINAIENLKYKKSIIECEYLKGKISTGNQNYFHTSKFSSSNEITINYLNTEQQLNDLYGKIYVVNENNEIINVYSKTILPAGTYYLEGYRLPIQIITDEILNKITNDFEITTIKNIVTYLTPSDKESYQARLKPFAKNDLQEIKGDYIQEFKYPTIPIWGHEYLQHWYEKIYEANQSATIVLDGDSITEGYDPEYSGIQDAFKDMRGYAIKKIMKAGNYPLSQLTLINNGHGGRKTGEWVGNPTYGASNYITQYPNGFLDVAMQNNPDLLIIAWGMNDADKTNNELAGLTLEERLKVFENNMIEGLQRIRGSIPVNNRPAYNKTINDLSIIICLPTVGGSEATGRGNYLWNQYIREIIRPLCRKYGCAFADMTMRTYAHNDMGDKIWSTLNSSGNYGGIHPNIWSSAQTVSMLQDLIYPICMWNLGEIE